MTNFASNINHVAKLDNSLAMSLVLTADNVVLKSGSTYDVSTTVSIYNRTTSITEYKTVTCTLNTTNIDTYLTSIKTQLELAYPVTVSHSTSVGINSVTISNIINVGLVVNTSGYYARGMVMNISLSGVQQYSIDATLVSPLEITPAILNTTPESLASLNSMSITTVAKASEASVSAASALNSLNTFNAAYATIQTSLDLKAPLVSPSLVTPNIGVALGTSFNGIAGLSSTTPNMDGTATIGTSTRVALADHIHPNDTSKSDLITTVVKDSDTGAAHMPSGTTAQRPVSPLNGYIRYNSDLLAMEAYVNGAWSSVGSGTTVDITLVFTKALFYGGYDGSANSSIITLLSSTATLVQAETLVGTVRSDFAGANVGINALFYAGYDGSTLVSIVTLLSPTATLVQAETSVGTDDRSDFAGANVGTNALFYAGFDNTDIVSTATLLSPTATLVQAETSVGTGRENFAGANVGINALFYAGDNNSADNTNITTLLSPTTTLVQAETTIGTARTNLAGATVGTNALFYGGDNTSVVSTATLLSPTATLVQAEVSVGTAKWFFAGANVGTNVLFYAGDNNSGAIANITTVLSPTAVLVQAETSVGTGRENFAGASL